MDHDLFLFFSLYLLTYDKYCFRGLMIVIAITPHNILSKPLAAFPHNHCQTTDSGERGINPVAMTIIKPWPSRGSNQRPPVLKSYTLPTDLFGLTI